MLRRKIPFPSSIDSCELLLVEAEYGPSSSLPSPSSASMFLGDQAIPANEHALFPYHDTSVFNISGALIGVYGDHRLGKKGTLYVSCLSNPKNIEAATDKIYNVWWTWRRRRIGEKAMTANWYFDNRGEDYSPKHIAAMALFRTYNNQLEDQGEANWAWQQRQDAAREYGNNRDYRYTMDAIVEQSHDRVINQVLAEYPDKTRGDLTEPSIEETSAEAAEPATNQGLISYGPFTNYPVSDSRGHFMMRGLVPQPYGSKN